MSWSQQLVPDILRHVPLLSSRRAATSPAIFLSSARYASRWVSPSSFDVQDMFAKALDFKGPGNKSPAEMWADKSNNLKLPPPPDTWTGTFAHPNCFVAEPSM